RPRPSRRTGRAAAFPIIFGSGLHYWPGRFHLPRCKLARGKLMRRLILFRFHDRPAICAGRIRHLRALNPDVAIHGLYGGPDDAAPALPELDTTYTLAGKSAHWKWKHSDLAARQWFQDVGRGMAFDILHLVEWDLLLSAPLDALYAHIPANA